MTGEKKLESEFIDWLLTKTEITVGQFILFLLLVGVLFFVGGNYLAKQNTCPVCVCEEAPVLTTEEITLEQFAARVMLLELPWYGWALLILIFFMVIK